MGASGRSPVWVEEVQRRDLARRTSFCATPSVMPMRKLRSAAWSRSSSMREKKRRKTSWQRSWRSAPGPKYRRKQPQHQRRQAGPRDGRRLRLAGNQRHRQGRVVVGRRNGPEQRERRRVAARHHVYVGGEYRPPPAGPAISPENKHFPVLVQVHEHVHVYVNGALRAPVTCTLTCTWHAWGLPPGMGDIVEEATYQARAAFQLMATSLVEYESMLST